MKTRLFHTWKKRFLKILVECVSKILYNTEKLLWKQAPKWKEKHSEEIHMWRGQGTKKINVVKVVTQMNYCQEIQS